MSIQNKLGEDIIPPLKKDENQNRKVKITDLIGKIRVLKSINFSISSKEPDIIKLDVFGKTISVPIKVFEKFAGEN